MRLVPESDALLRWLALPFAAVAGAGLAAATWRPELLLRMAHCPWRELTGLPCPTCGGTHAAVALAAGDWGAAWRSNPLVPAGVVLVAAWAVWALAAAGVPALRVRPRPEPGERRAARLGAALLLLALALRQALTL